MLPTLTHHTFPMLPRKYGDLSLLPHLARSELNAHLWLKDNKVKEHQTAVWLLARVSYVLSAMNDLPEWKVVIWTWRAPITLISSFIFFFYFGSTVVAFNDLQFRNNPYLVLGKAPQFTHCIKQAILASLSIPLSRITCDCSQQTESLRSRYTGLLHSQAEMTILGVSTLGDI